MYAGEELVGVYGASDFAQERSWDIGKRREEDLVDCIRNYPKEELIAVSGCFDNCMEAR